MLVWDGELVVRTTAVSLESFTPFACLFFCAVAVPLVLLEALELESLEVDWLELESESDDAGYLGSQN